MIAGKDLQQSCLGYVGLQSTKVVGLQNSPNIGKFSQNSHGSYIKKQPLHGTNFHINKSNLINAMNYQEKRGQNNDSAMNIYSLIREKSIEEISAVGKNLSFQAVIAAGGNTVSSNLGKAQNSGDMKNINLPVIYQKDGVKP